MINEGPLERGFVWETEILARADPATALEQIIAEVERLRGDGRLDEARCAARADSIGSIQTHRSAQLAAAEAVTTPALTTPYLIAAVRTALQRHTPSHGTNIHVLNESVSNYPAVWEHLRALSMCTSGGSSLGWALGAAVGAGLANREMAEENRWEMAVVVVGDGSFLFGAPGAAYWMARRYSTVREWSRWMYSCANELCPAAISGDCAQQRRMVSTASFNAWCPSRRSRLTRNKTRSRCELRARITGLWRFGGCGRQSVDEKNRKRGRCE